MQLQEEISRLTRQHFDRAPDQCDDHQLYQALLILARQRAQARPAPTGDRKLYYFSAEFLLGKLLSNQLLALGLYQPVKDYLAGMGRDLGVLESMEPEPSLGNGGLGRLAACFLDSIAALGLPGDGFYACHIHALGDCCTGGDVAFHCAGPHYDPEGREHPNHAGDLPVLLSSGGRALSLVYTGRFQPGQVLGRSVVLHALPDDYRSQPTGAAGGRIACGVISPVA